MNHRAYLTKAAVQPEQEEKEEGRPCETKMESMWPELMQSACNLHACCALMKVSELHSAHGFCCVLWPALSVWEVAMAQKQNSGKSHCMQWPKSGYLSCWAEEQERVSTPSTSAWHCIREPVQCKKKKTKTFRLERKEEMSPLEGNGCKYMDYVWREESFRNSPKGGGIHNC